MLHRVGQTRVSPGSFQVLKGLCHRTLTKSRGAGGVCNEFKTKRKFGRKELSFSEGKSSVIT